MARTDTLQEILTYSTKFKWDTVGIILFDSVFTFLVTMIMVVGGLFFAYIGVMSMIEGEGEGSLSLIIVVMGVAILMVTGMFHVSAYDKLTPESLSSYKAEEAKWEREMATPYINGLPDVIVNDIESVAYNYELEVESDSGSEKNRQGGKEDMPVKVIFKDGEVFEAWAKVVPLKEEMNTSQLEFKELEKDLIFHERSGIFQEKGYFDIVLYTDEKL